MFVALTLLLWQYEYIISHAVPEKWSVIDQYAHEKEAHGDTNYYPPTVLLDNISSTHVMLLDATTTSSEKYWLQRVELSTSLDYSLLQDQFMKYNSISAGH